MTVVSSKEFVSHEDKYFDMAMNEQIFVQRGNVMFLVTRAVAAKKKHKQPDEDFRRAITMDEFKQRALVMVEKVHKKYINERNHIA